MGAPVIVHRWFERGAAWAYAPEISDTKLEIIASLDSELRKAVTGVFCHQTTTGCFMVGSVVGDPECPDRKAKDRGATILRAAMVASRPSSVQTAAIVEGLAQFWPIRPGADSSLRVTVPNEFAQQAPGTVESNHSGRNRTKVFIATLAVAALAACGVLFFQVFGPVDQKKRNDLKPIALGMKQQLADWGENVNDLTDNDVVTRYFQILSRSQFRKDGLAIDHPYVEFVNRLPPISIRPTDGDWTDGDLNRGLSDLLARFERRRDTGAVAPAPQNALRSIETAMNYDAWRRKSRSAREGLERFATSPDTDVLDYVERFRPTAASEFADVVATMQKALLRWHVKVDQNENAFQILRKFFTTLERPEWLGQCSAEDRSHAYWGFVDRLPGNSGCLGWTADDREQLEKALRSIAQRLGGSVEGKTAQGLVETVVRQMDYEAWSSRDEVTFKKDGKPRSKDLVGFVDRFRSPEP